MIEWAAIVARDEVGVRLEALSRLEAALARADASSRERLEDEAIEARALLIAAATGDDVRAPTWMIDQAAAVLARASRDASDTRVLAGIPTSGALERARSAALEAATLVSRAEAMIDRLKEREDAGGRVGGDLILDRMRVLVEDEKGVRVPFFRARSACVLAASGEAGESRREAASLAIASAESIVLDDPGAEAMRRVSLAFGLLSRGAAGDAPRARALCEGVIEGGGVWSGTLAEAHLGRALAAGRAEGANAAGRAVDALRRALAREPFVGGGGATDALLVVIAHETMARALLEAGEGRNVQLQREACETLASLVDREDLGLTREERWSVASERLAACLGPTAPFVQLPVPAALARASAALREEGGREEAVRLLTHASGREDAGAWREEALWELAVVLTASESEAERLRGSRALARLARDFPRSARAGRALGAALAFARRAADGSSGSLRAEALEVYAEALALACEPSSGVIELEDRAYWWCERARLVFEGGGEGPEREEARTLLERIEPGSALGATAASLFLADADRELSRERAKGEAALARGDERGARAIATDVVLPLAARALAMAERHADASTARRRFEHAEAMIEAGRREALSELDALERAWVEGTVDGPRSARWRLARARALILGARGTEAFPILRELAEELELVEPRDARFWQVWTLMLETLVEGEADRSAEVRTHVARLRSLDAALGGQPWSLRLERVERGAR